MAIFTDDFNRANGPIGSNYDEGYSVGAVKPNVVSNQVTTSAAVPVIGATENFTTLNTALPGGNQYACVDLVIRGDLVFDSPFSLILRGTAPTTFSGYAAVNYTPGRGSDVIQFLRYDSNTPASVNAIAAAIASGQHFAFTARGSVLAMFGARVFLMGGLDATYATGRPGIRVSSPDGTTIPAIGDNFAAGDLPITVVSAGTEGSAASGNITPGTPGSLATNDLLICVCHSSDQVSHSMGAGWTQLVQGNGGGTTSRLSVWWHRYDGAAMASALITHTAGQSPIAAITAFRAFDANTIVTVDVTGSITGGTDASMEHATVTPTQDFGLLLLCSGAADDNNLTLPVGYAAAFTEAGPTNNFKTVDGTPDGMVCLLYRDSLAAATGTISITQVAADPWASVQIALKTVLVQSGPVRQMYLNQAVTRAAYF